MHFLMYSNSFGLSRQSLRDEDKTKDQLIRELVRLRQCVSELETSESDHKQLEEALRKNFSVIGTLTRSMHMSINLREILDDAVKSMHKNIKEAHSISIYFIEGEKAVLKTYRGYADSAIERTRSIPYPQGPVWKTIIEGKPRYVADAGKEAVIGIEGKVPDIKSYLSIPLGFEGRTVGCINVGSLKKNAFNEQTLKLMEIVSKQIEMAINNEKQTHALVQSEQRYRTLFDQSPVGVYIFDTDFKITHCNERFVQILRSSYEKIIGLDLHKLKDPTFMIIMRKALEGQFCHQESLYEATTSPAKLWLSVRVSPLRDVDGNVISGMGVIEDITERKRAEEELLRVEKLESLSVLASGIAHDFNNLLTAILGNISLAKISVTPQDTMYKRLLEAEKATLRTKDLTQQLLTFAKGGVPIKKTTSIAELIKDSASFVLKGSNVRCEFSISDNLWPAEVDEGQMNQVIYNLIINANQAMPEGGIIKVCAENVTIGPEHGLPLRDGKYVKITIEDQGVGISEENLPKIFDPYFTTKEKGSGLGLATVYSIINKHEGFITLESEVGVGTTFYIYIPASQKEIPIRRKEEEESPIKSQGKILVMDDEEIIREVLGEMLNSIGFKVEFAKDGGQAIEQYEKARESGEPFDSVILDLTVPGGMGGKEAIEKLITKDPQVKAIVSSGYSNDPIMAEFHKYGFKGFVAKPYKIQELSRILRTVINENK